VYSLPPDGVDLERLERELVLQALEAAKGNKTRAGRLLGLNRDQVRYRLEKFRLEAADGAHEEKD
jgi:DNA-binding protein Fis